MGNDRTSTTEHTFVRQIKIPGSASAYRFDRFPEFRVPGSDFDENDVNSGVLTGLSAINLLVGPNNSGKSRFLRALHRDKWQRILDGAPIRAFERCQRELMVILREKKEALNNPTREIVTRVATFCLLLEQVNITQHVGDLRDSIRQYRSNWGGR